MKYALINQNGLLEIREDSYELADGAIELTDEQYAQLCDGTSTLQNGQIVNNPDFKPLVVSTPSYADLRREAYPPMTDYLDGIVKGDEAQMQKYINDCLAVKAKYPKD